MHKYQAVANDLAVFSGMALIGYSLGGHLGAGTFVVSTAFVFALADDGGEADAE